MPKKAPKSILIYRLGSLGDTIVAVPCLSFIRNHFPSAKITLLTNEPISGKAAPAMSILENSGLCDESIGYPLGLRDVRKLARLCGKIRDQKFDLAINLAASRGASKSIRDWLFLTFCGIRKVVGTPWRIRSLKNRLVGVGLYESESAHLARRLKVFGEPDLIRSDTWDLFPNASEVEKAEKLLVSIPGDYLVVSVGTKQAVKDWGLENWGILIRKISEVRSHSGLVLLGAPDEFERSAELAKFWHGPSVNLCGLTSPRVSFVICKNACLFIGHDSGPMHLAGAAQAPTIGIFSWQNPPGQWFPGNSNWPFIRPLYPPLPPDGWRSDLMLKRSATEGILLIKPETVYEESLGLWRKNNSSCNR